MKSRLFTQRSPWQSTDGRPSSLGRSSKAYRANSGVATCLNFSTSGFNAKMFFHREVWSMIPVLSASIPILRFEPQTKVRNSTVQRTSRLYFTKYVREHELALFGSLLSLISPLFGQQLRDPHPLPPNVRLTWTSPRRHYDSETCTKNPMPERCRERDKTHNFKDNC